MTYAEWARYGENGCLAPSIVDRSPPMGLPTPPIEIPNPGIEFPNPGIEISKPGIEFSKPGTEFSKPGSESAGAPLGEAARAVGVARCVGTKKSVPRGAAGSKGD